MIFYASMYTEGLIHDAITSKIYLGRMMESLKTVIEDVSDEHSGSEDVFRAYERFFHVLQNELEEQRVEKVEIGMALDVTGCEVAHTLEMTSNGFFICSEGKREECPLQDVLEDMYQPEHVIGCVIGAITRRHKKLLIEDLKSGIKYVSDLVDSEHKRRVNSDSLCYTNGTENHIMDVCYNPTTRETDIDTRTAAPTEGKKESDLKKRDTEDNNNQSKTSNSREYNIDS